MSRVAPAVFVDDASPAMCVEGGGTHSRAALHTAVDADGGFVADAGRCNPTTNLEAARESVEALWEQLAAKHGCARAETRLVLGCAGLVPEDVRAAFVGGFKGFRSVTPLSDGYVALVGAGGGQACGMIVAGTGCAGHRMRPDGTSLQRDGWGWIAGDRGSGAWIGLQALRHALTVRDGLLPEDELARVVLPELGADNAAIAGWFQDCEPVDVARFARHVFDRAAAGDELAEDILQRAAGHLRDLFRSLGCAPDEPLYMAGSIATALAERIGAGMETKPQAVKGKALEGCALVAFGKAPLEWPAA
ncbi:MAG: hypothetical protein ISN26_01800 [Betaproteobacteria bacterium AqS2]|uniref:ATPase BadF/BadG/BcrA/BcrD type domain-containing protein n=1 Tax=Candidatus Amphirhobacter heronislandensis TaxID=1732024 RepID=A0A930Y0Z4_9GAMM|nr:hypothetical protein [Betaproteobacteria bacterium AqS2]